MEVPADKLQWHQRNPVQESKVTELLSRGTTATSRAPPPSDYLLDKTGNPRFPMETDYLGRVWTFRQVWISKRQKESIQTLCGDPLLEVRRWPYHLIHLDCQSEGFISSPSCGFGLSCHHKILHQPREPTLTPWISAADVIGALDMLLTHQVPLPQRLTPLPSSPLPK